MKHLSQRDRRWAGVKMRPSGLTLGRYGCTTTCISMLSDYFGCYRSPDVVATKNVRYTAGGLILWGSIDFPCFRFASRKYGRDEREIDISLKDPDKAVILEVANRSHWVVALRKIPFTHVYLIADPWDGKVKLSTAYKNITGSSHFRRNGLI